MVTPRYLPLTGGVELHVHETARRLVQRGVEVTVLTTDPKGMLADKERVEGIEVRRVRAWPANRDYHLAPGIRTEIAAGEWDVVHVQSYHTLVAPLAMLTALRTGCPYVVTFHAGGHSSPIRHRLRPTQLFALRPLFSRAHRLITLAPFEADRYAALLRLPRERFAVIPNGSDLPLVELPRRRDDALLASIGRLERYKGHHRVLAALPHVARRCPDVRLWIAGSGPYEESLARLAAELGVSERVEIRAVPAEERELMARELGAVSVAVLLSEFETQPIAALEALALGCRLVVADTPGLLQLAEDGLARSVPLDSPPELVAAAILHELNAPPAPKAPPLPTWDDCTAALLRLYAAAAGRGPGGSAASGSLSVGAGA
jgi:glycosyltransferase involved in cell wall biosynthesis